MKHNEAYYEKKISKELEASGAYSLHIEREGFPDSLVIRGSFPIAVEYKIGEPGSNVLELYQPGQLYSGTKVQRSGMLCLTCIYVEGYKSYLLYKTSDIYDYFVLTRSRKIVISEFGETDYHTTYEFSDSPADSILSWREKHGL